MLSRQPVSPAGAAGNPQLDPAERRRCHRNALDPDGDERLDARPVARHVAAERERQPLGRRHLTTIRMRRSTAGSSGSISSATRPPASREAAITYCVRSFEPIEAKSTGMGVEGEGGCRGLHHDADRRHG
ncbi:MAG: hypothetical protein IPM60_14055 [Rhodospirillales bacterium]|nr:hypothetical protein [Rhodospirillales bacterium]